MVGTLEVRLHVPATPKRAVVICHPHPSYGGSMHSPVPLSVAKTLSDRALETVAWARFNFRGVGRSGGVHDDGAGETDDALQVMTRLRTLAPRVPVALCGHSFGSWIAMRAASRAADAGIDRVLMIAPSTRFFDFGDEVMAFAGLRTIFLGDQDEFCDVDEGRALADKLGASIRIFEGFDHHFTKSRRTVAEAALPVIAPEAEA